MYQYSECDPIILLTMYIIVLFSTQYTIFETWSFGKFKQLNPIQARVLNIKGQKTTQISIQLTLYKTNRNWEEKKNKNSIIKKWTVKEFKVFYGWFIIQSNTDTNSAILNNSPFPSFMITSSCLRVYVYITQKWELDHQLIMKRPDIALQFTTHVFSYLLPSRIYYLLNPVLSTL